MSWLHGISARSLRHLERIEIDLSPAPGRERRHLVLIGPNGSGKSTVLAAVAGELEALLDGKPHPAAELTGRTGDPEALDRELRLAHFGRPLRLAWAQPERELREAFAAGKLILAYLPDPRETSVLPAAQPSPTDTDPRRPRDRAGQRLLQLLVNRKAEERLAAESGNPGLAQVHAAWFLRVQAALRRLLHAPALVLAHDRDGFHLDLPDGRRMHPGELSRGHAAAVAIWAEIMTRVEAARLRNEDPMLEPAGVVVIDAVETSLDVRLQRELLPALADLYPRVQLVVTTCSPLVALSLDDAIVFDVVTRRARESEEVRKRGVDALLLSMIGSPPRAATRPPPPPPPAPPRRPAAPLDPEATTPNARLPVPAKHGRSLPPTPPRKPSAPPPPATLPPKPAPRSRRSTTPGGPWGDDEQ